MQESHLTTRCCCQSLRAVLRRSCARAAQVGKQDGVGLGARVTLTSVGSFELLQTFAFAFLRCGLTHLCGFAGLKNVVAAVEWAVRCELTAEVDAALQQQHAKGLQQQQQHVQQQQQQQQQRHSLNVEPISSQHMQHINAMFLAGQPFSPE
jgi:hypothetical protein